MADHLSDHEFTQALAAIEAEDIGNAEKVDMLVQIAMGIQQKPKSTQAIHNAITLYDKALSLCSQEHTLETARIRARKATALQAIPDSGTDSLHKAQLEIEAALAVLGEQGNVEETAEAEMNLGLILQTLAGAGQGMIADAIKAYQRSLRVFTRASHPTEYAILHNNLATAYLSIPSSDERSKMREALAVQSFEEALKVVNLIDQPSEYAMLQNNLGNALQYVASGHGVQNNERALEAYDEALKVRTEADTPLEYANTLCNKSNCLRNLPDDPADPGAGNRENLVQARLMYRKAKSIFERFGDSGKLGLIDEILVEIEQDLGTGRAGSRSGHGFGESRV